MDIKLGLITGTGISSFAAIEKDQSIQMHTPYGDPSSELQIGKIDKTGIAYIMRHGREKNVPPHKINHRANLWALREIGASKIISTTSVGSLKLDIEPPCILIPDDYVNIANVPTFFDEEIKHITPRLDEGLRQLIMLVAREEGIEVKDSGTYVQTKGPRLETPAEIRIFRTWGDVIGMNMASEATLAREIDLHYANVSSVDNYGHGMTQPPPTYESIVANARKNWDRISQLIVGIAGKLE